MWRIIPVSRNALIFAGLPPIPLALLNQAAAIINKPLSNPKRTRKQAVNYPRWGLS